VDKPGARLCRLEENLARWRNAGLATEVSVLGADVLALQSRTFTDIGLPCEFDGVFIDVPCSNTGVIRHRVDAKWRLQPGDFARLAGEQIALLEVAARHVRPGGRLVYSTCSLEPEENEGVVAAFLAVPQGRAFVIEESRQGRPWLDGHDGAGAFRLRRVGA
jgi:16S rRNA (cytosine967-C5)-methyltransferase